MRHGLAERASRAWALAQPVSVVSACAACALLVPLLACAPPSSPPPQRAELALLGDDLAWADPQAEDVRSLSVADMDADGDLDLAVGNLLGGLRVIRNDLGSLGLAWSEATSSGEAEIVSWGDVDGDGALELAVADAAGSLRLYAADGDGGFGQVWQRGSVSSGVADIAWGDADGTK